MTVFKAILKTWQIVPSIVMTGIGQDLPPTQIDINVKTAKSIIILEVSV